MKSNRQAPSGWWVIAFAALTAGLWAAWGIMLVAERVLPAAGTR